MIPTNRISKLQRDAIQKNVENIANASSEEELSRCVNESIKLRLSLVGKIEQYLDDKLDSAFYMAERAYMSRADSLGKAMYLDEVQRDLFSFDSHIIVE